jgi:Fe-S oxidoreductase
MGAVEAVLRAVPGLDVRPIQSSCCGMAGAFGFEADKIGVSLAMAELSLFPALRKASPGDLIVADGTSCRHQIADGLGLEAVHVARVLDEALGPPSPAQARGRRNPAAILTDSRSMAGGDGGIGGRP